LVRRYRLKKRRKGSAHARAEGLMHGRNRGWVGKYENKGMLRRKKKERARKKGLKHEPKLKLPYVKRTPGEGGGGGKWCSEYFRYFQVV
jgi:hypothetical protein